jgi:protoheme IX farnesyltransferase
VGYTKLQILIYTSLLVVCSLLPSFIGTSGFIYLVYAAVLGFGFLRHAVALYQSDSDELAMKTFGYSIYYLSLLFVILLADHYARMYLQITPF